MRPQTLVHVTLQVLRCTPPPQLVAQLLCGHNDDVARRLQFLNRGGDVQVPVHEAHAALLASAPCHRTVTTVRVSGSKGTARRPRTAIRHAPWVGYSNSAKSSAISTSVRSTSISAMR